MSLTLQQLRDDLRDQLGVDDIELPDPKADLLLNKSWWQIADDYDFREKETTRTYNTVAGTSAYAVASDTNALEQVSIEDDSGSQHSLLKPMTLLTYESDYVDTVNSRGKPEYYIRRGSSVILWPTPDAVYEITEYYWKTLIDIETGGVTIPRAWHEAILYGAAYRGFAQFGDFNRSRAAKMMQNELLETKETTRTKEHADLPMASVRIIRPRYR